MKVISPILPKIGCHGNVPWGIKNWSWLTTFTQIPSFGGKNRENRSRHQAEPSRVPWKMKPSCWKWRLKPMPLSNVWPKYSGLEAILESRFLQRPKFGFYRGQKIKVQTKASIASQRLTPIFRSRCQAVVKPVVWRPRQRSKR